MPPSNRSRQAPHDIMKEYVRFSQAVQTGGSVASDAVMGAFHNYHHQRTNYHQAGGGMASGTIPGKGASMGYGNYPSFPNQTSTPSDAAPLGQRLLASQTYETMGNINRSVTYPNPPLSTDPLVFGGAPMAKRNSKAKAATSTREKKPASKKRPAKK